MSIHGWQVTFCDDVRPEAGGKFSIMGIYRDFIAVPAPQALFSRFVVLMVLDYDEAAVGQQVKVELKDRDTVMMSMDLALPGRAPQPMQFPRLPALHLVIPLELGGFVLTPDMEIQLQLHADGAELRSEVLAVVQAPPQPAAPGQAP